MNSRHWGGNSAPRKILLRRRESRSDLAPGGGSPRHVVVDLIQDTLPFNYPAFVKVRHTVVETHDGLRNRFFVLRPSLSLRHSPGDAGLRGFCLPVGSNTPDPG